ncbi:MAG: EamA family transporter [Anaerolineae bacterium]|jgi:drug/metabolite transporter (DMT)-like permease|nr:EamA family transporter [Anaerolineae bacterium]MBT7189084.1 EamA family transporter [Anaerolineae bacterium]MBT7990357.1 EamA family transporter [Anaerolineae bacterium]
MIAALFGLASALSWGTGDFAGGLASRKLGAYKAVMMGYAIGLGFLLIALPFIDEPFPDIHTILWSSVAGIAGAIGLLFFFEAMRLGRISIAAPLSALIGAIIPVVVGSFIEGIPQPIVFLAFGLALIAVALISIEKDEGENKRNAHLYLPILAGTAFGLYFVFMNEASEDLVIGPLITARSSGMLSIAAYLLFKRESFRIESGSWHLLTINGFFDVGGNLFYILAAQAGRLDISAVLSSLFPGMTVFLAWLILKERLQSSQWIGILLALISIILIATA